MQAKKRQHYVDQELQRNFLERGEEKLWVYDRIAKEYRRQHPKDIAVEGHLYSLNTPELEDQRYSVEDAFQKLQAKALPALAKLRAGQDITQPERFNVCEYVGFQVVRTPEHMTITKEVGERAAQYMYEALVQQMIDMPKADYEKLMTKYRAEAGITHEITQADWRAVLEEKRLKAKQPIDYHIGMMVDVGTEIGLGFSKKHWIVLHAKHGRSFIASDVPAIQMPTPNSLRSKGVGPLAPGIANYFPFAKDAALLILPQEQPIIEHATIKDDGLHKFNRNIALDCKRVIFSGSRELLARTVSRSGIDHIETRIIYDDETIRRQMQEILTQSTH